MKWALMRAFVVVSAAVCAIAALPGSDAATANPIRKVVTTMQALQAKVEAEVEKEKELFGRCHG